MADDDIPVTVSAEMVRETVEGREPELRHPTGLRARVLSGSVIMLVSSGLVGAINLLYNLVVAHSLGAAGFGQASAVYTVLMLLSSVTLSFQLLCSKFVARNEAPPIKVGIYKFLHTRAWLVGFVVSLLLAGSAPIISSYLNLPTRNYILMLAGATVFYVPLGVRRGFMQGTYAFTRLALNFVLEVVVKLVGTLMLIAAGLGVTGVIAAVMLSVVISYLLGHPGRQGHADPHTRLPAAFQEGVQTSVFFVGQVIINNLDIILVKHFFEASAAGVYAAVALVGRVVYMLSWSVVSGMFPFSARAGARERDGKTVLSTGLLMVVLITSVFTLSVWLAPPRLWHFVLGSGFAVSGGGSYSSLLVLYAATTGIYSLAVVLMSYEISRKIGNVSWLQLAFGGAIIAGIYLFHGTLRDVITVQLVLMLVLLVMVSIPFLRARENRAVGALADSDVVPLLRRIRPVKEDEVIAEFLKGEFYQREFEPYRDQFRELVLNPDFRSPRENTVRRALLYLRRGRLWRELPQGTEWWELELRPSDLDKLRVFPRNHWRRLAEPNYYLTQITESIRRSVETRPDEIFAKKMCSLRDEFEDGSQVPSSVLLIGIDDASPLTIIEGNHRMAAAALYSPHDAHLRYRFFCGFSPNMKECCWYQTDFSTLVRYARNFVTFLLDDHRVVIRQAASGSTEAASDAGVGAA